MFLSSIPDLLSILYIQKGSCYLRSHFFLWLTIFTLLSTVDPEMRAEFEQQSRASPLTGATTNAMTGGGFDLAGWMAGTAPNPMASAEGPREGATGRETTTGSARKRG